MASAMNSSERKYSIDEQRQLTAVMDSLNDTRKEGTLCDVTLVVQGKRFPAHRAVLAATSDFFRLMFTTRMVESTSHEVELIGAVPEIIELLIQFIYTGRISVNNSNVQTLLETAIQYQIEPVKKMCVEFLKGQLDVQNCLEVMAFANFYNCPDLNAEAEDFLHLHFTEVYKLDTFLKLVVTDITRILQEDKLVVQSEDQIYDAAVRWLKHDVCNRRQYIVELLGCVRFPLVSQDFLYTTVEPEPLIHENQQCLKMVISGFQYHWDLHERHHGSEERCRPRRKKHNHYIAVFESPQLQSIKFFYPQDCTWREFRCPTVKSRGATAVFCDYVVYIIGGCKAYHMPSFNVFEKQWQSKSAPPINRDFPAACVSEGMIYTSGGVVGKSALDVFECYDTRTESWQVKPSMMTARCDHGSVAASGLIYVCGGTVSKDVSSKVLNNFEVFDPSTQNWTRLRGMKGARKNHGLVVVNKRIYAVGGQGASGVLDSVEYYDIASNQWHGASPIPWRFVSLKCVAVKDMIYVLAGRGFERALPLKYVLEYQTRTNRWMTCRKADAFPNPTCLLCVIAVPSEDTGLD